MNKIEFALKLAKDCTYADELTYGAKEHLRNEIDEALREVKNLSSNPVLAVSLPSDWKSIIKILESRKEETKKNDLWLMGCNSGLEDAIQQIQKYFKERGNDR